MAIPASYGAVQRFFKAERIGFKKSLHASEQDRPDVARRRLRWRQHQASVEASRLVFIDETWAKTNMTRTHGRCVVGKRLVDKVPFGHWKTMTFLAALRCDRIDAPCVFDGQSTANASALMSNRRSSRRSNREISWSWIISAATRAKLYAAQSGVSAQSSFSCRRTVPTSIQSSRSSPSSKPYCEKPKSAHQRKMAAHWNSPRLLHTRRVTQISDKLRLCCYLWITL